MHDKHNDAFAQLMAELETLQEQGRIRDLDDELARLRMNADVRPPRDGIDHDVRREILEEFEEREPLLGWRGRHVGNFALSTLMSRGGFGTVYRATQETVGGRPAVVKLLGPHPNIDGGVLDHDFEVRSYSVTLEQARGIARKELEHVSAVSSRSIIEVLDSGVYTLPHGSSEADADYFVPWVASRWVAHAEPYDSYWARAAFTPIDKLKDFKALCDTVQNELHRLNVVHADLKPDNVLVRRNTGEHVIIDFGFAREVAPGQAMRPEHQCGTEHYAAPELYFGVGQAPGPEVDVYALGVMLYELIEGCGFPDRPTAMQFKALTGNAGKTFEEIIRAATDSEPRNRTPNAGVLARELDELIRLQSAAPAPPPASRTAVSPAPPSGSWKWGTLADFEAMDRPAKEQMLGEITRRLNPPTRLDSVMIDLHIDSLFHPSRYLSDGERMNAFKIWFSREDEPVLSRVYEALFKELNRRP